MNREIILKSDDVRAVRYRPTDGNGWLWDVEVLWEDGAVLTIGATDGRHARALFAQLNTAAHINYNARPCMASA